MPASAATSYTVKAGDSLYKIGRYYGVSVNSLKAANGLKTNNIYPGQRLIIPQQYAQPSRAGSYSRDNLTLLAKLIYGEARGESYVGQVAVAAVVLNRVESPLFPNTVAGVIFQPGAFTAVSDGQFYLQPDQTAYKAAQDALNGWDPTHGALYYYNPEKTINKWIWSRPVVARIGKHVFAK
ncbi:MAG: LysM peptidoglycan-binding domain-containing protein [Firmicutes bacterium]|nr:LysM peptidoglycan-binding domain-containing protein [Bacillota bacterium]